MSGRLRWLVAALALTAPLATQAASLDRLHAYLETTRSARADFTQKVYDRSGKLVQSSSGHFEFVRPGRFRWVYAKPYPQLIVGDGERVWIYDEDLNQVTVRRMAKALGSTPAALLAGGADVDRAFALTDAGERDGLEWVQAVPRDPDAGFARIRMGFGPSGIEAMELFDNFGQRTELRFSSFERNVQVDPKQFEFVPPAGADVLGTG
jgi:outer membrane lipoprotein carrier protein